MLAERERLEWRPSTVRPSGLPIGQFDGSGVRRVPQNARSRFRLMVSPTAGSEPVRFLFGPSSAPVTAARRERFEAPAATSADPGLPTRPPPLCAFWPKATEPERPNRLWLREWVCFLKASAPGGLVLWRISVRTQFRGLFWW